MWILTMEEVMERLPSHCMYLLGSLIDGDLISMSDKDFTNLHKVVLEKAVFPHS
jgi:hypothetical protein